MEQRLILSKNFVDLDLKNHRLYFLAGPIRGDGDWQRKAITLLFQLDPSCYIAVQAGTTKRTSIGGYLYLRRKKIISPTKLLGKGSIWNSPLMQVV